MDKSKVYSHYRKGDYVRIEIRDYTHRTIYKNKFNIKDKNSILALLRALEKFSGFSVQEIIKRKIETDWF